jgi:hypothetical protein
MRTKAKPNLPRGGYWEENKSPWYEQTTFYCEACGMLIPRRQFIVNKDGRSHRFCGESCAILADQIEGMAKARRLPRR